MVLDCRLCKSLILLVIEMEAEADADDEAGGCEAVLVTGGLLSSAGW